jgi:hypothetical protein
MRRTLAAVVVLVLFPLAALAQGSGSFEWFPGGTYDASIPTPASYLGYGIGERFTFHHQVKGYLEVVAAASDRVTIDTYGTTNEGRELLLLTVTSPANHGRIDQIRANMARLADPRGASEAELQRIIEGSPAIAWLSYNVHGNESSCTEAALQVVYQLAAGTDPVTRRILEETAVIIDPLSNPDGRERYVASFTKRMGREMNTDPAAWEHSEDAPGGRVNHYLFDLNRDWAWQSQVETQQRIRTYLEWNPVVHVDFHEMGGTSYFFFPASPPVHTAYPDVVLKWQRIYGEGNAAAFDVFGWNYYTRQTFDMYYPSYGDSWPSMMGAIGMTYEQGGGGGVGLGVERGEVVHTLKIRAHGHFTTSMATLRTTAERRQERLTDFLAFFRAALELGQGPVKAYALVPGRDPYNLARLTELLLAQGFEIDRADGAFRARVAAAYGNTPVPSSAREFPAGTLLVNASQPKGVAVQMLLEPRPVLEDTSFYDLSAWSLPLAFGVEAWGLGEMPRSGLTRVTAPAPRQGAVVGGREAYAWVIPYEGTPALLAANDLLSDEVMVRSAGKTFTAGGREFPLGSFVVPRFRNPDDLYRRLERVTAEWGVSAYAVPSGLVTEGDDLGWGGYSTMQKPQIAVAGGFSLSSFGEVWHFLDQRFPYFDYTIVDAERLGGLDLSEYNVLILPSDGSGRRYTGWFGEAGLDALREWLRGGGVLIGFEGGATFATQSGAGLTSVTTQSAGGGGGGRRGMGGEEPVAEGAAPRRGQTGVQGGGEPAVQARRTLAEREAEGGRNRTPGGLYEVVLDPDHWLAFGMPERLAVLKRGTQGFAVTQSGVNVGVFSEHPLLSGYAPEQVPGALSRLSWLIVENVGRGKVVLFADDPLFRMFVEGQHQLVLNAILLGPAF